MTKKPTFTESVERYAAAFDEAKHARAAGGEFSHVDQIAEHFKKKHGDAVENLALSEDKHAIALDNVRIAPKARGQGLGAELLGHLKEHATRTGRPVVLSAEPDKGKKASLERFYKAHGFVRPRANQKDHSLPRHTHIFDPGK